jgi:hypothetical protein
MGGLGRPPIDFSALGVSEQGQPALDASTASGVLGGLLRKEFCNMMDGMAGRPPIGERPMTAAERMRRHRARPPEITELRNELRTLVASLEDGIARLQKRLADAEARLAETERKRQAKVPPQNRKSEDT